MTPKWKKPKSERDRIAREASELNAACDALKPKPMSTRKTNLKPGRRTPIPVVRSDELCKRLVAIAAFNLYDEPEAQKVIYSAVRTLQRLDAEAAKIGIPLIDAPLAAETQG